jgi:hypothetical protein
MFKCQISQRNSKPGQKAHKITVETRQKEYFERQRSEETKMWSDVMVGRGFETVREITVSEEGLALWNTWSDEERKLFLIELARG